MSSFNLSCSDFFARSWVPVALLPLIVGCDRRQAYRWAARCGRRVFFCGMPFVEACAVVDWLRRRAARRAGQLQQAA